MKMAGLVVVASSRADPPRVGIFGVDRLTPRGVQTRGSRLRRAFRPRAWQDQSPNQTPKTNHGAAAAFAARTAWFREQIRGWTCEDSLLKGSYEDDPSRRASLVRAQGSDGTCQRTPVIAAGDRIIARAGTFIRGLVDPVCRSRFLRPGSVSLSAAGQTDANHPGSQVRRIC